MNNDELVKKFLTDINMELQQIVLPDDSMAVASVTAAELKKGQDEAIPLIKLFLPKINRGSFFNTLNQVAAIIKKCNPDLIADVEQVESCLPTEPADQDFFIEQAVYHKTDLLSTISPEISPEIFNLLVGNTVRLFIEKFTKEAHPIYDYDQWFKGICPVCGAKPHMAIIENESKKRSLFCGLCGTKWHFQRLGCPYCLSEESQFFTLEGMEKYRVYYCDNCRGYIKTIDGSRIASHKIDMGKENLNTLQLDCLAINEGYFK